MTLTRRGWIVLTVGLMAIGFTIGWVTADVCWYGRC